MTVAGVVIPACGFGLSASFAGHTLAMNFNLGLNRPAIWSVSAGNGFELRRPIHAVAPPYAFMLAWGDTIQLYA
jgi:hypothetical protein